MWATQPEWSDNDYNSHVSWSQVQAPAFLWPPRWNPATCQFRWDLNLSLYSSVSLSHTFRILWRCCAIITAPYSMFAIRKLCSWCMMLKASTNGALCAVTVCVKWNNIWQLHFSEHPVWIQWVRKAICLKSLFHWVALQKLICFGRNHGHKDYQMEKADRQSHDKLTDSLLLIRVRVFRL